MDIALSADLLQPGEAKLQLGATPAQKEQARSLINKIVLAIHNRLHPAKVYEGGSFKKGTALKYKFDVDLVVFLNGFDASKMNEYQEQCKDALIDAFGPQVQHDSSTPYCVRVTVDSQRFDLLITGEPTQAPVGNPPRYYQAASSQQNDEEILEALERWPVLLGLILLAKHWRNLCPKRKLCTSYYIELLCLRSLKSTASTPPRNECAAFERFLRDVAQNDLKVCNANGSDFEYNTEELKKYAQDTLSSNLFAARNVGVIAVPAGLESQILKEGYRCTKRRRVPCSHNREDALEAFKRFRPTQAHRFLEVIALPAGVTTDAHKSGLKINTPHLPAECLRGA